MASSGANLSPKSWVRYWMVGTVLIGPACAVTGVIAGDLKLVFVGVAIIFVGIAMIAFWRQKAADADQVPDAN